MKKKETKSKEPTISFLKNEIELGESKIRNLQKLPDSVTKLYDKYIEAKKEYEYSIKKDIDKVREYICECRDKMRVIKAKKNITLPTEIQLWFENYKNGIDWGYGIPRIVYISKSNEYVIISLPGGTAGTGTPMGTGGYYYAKAVHWVAKVDLSKNHYGFLNNKSMEVYGRLTKKLKDLMIQFIDECIAGERTFGENDNSLIRVYPEAFTEDEKKKINEYR